MTDAKTVTVKHPDIKDLEKKVPANAVDKWVAQGWVAPKTAAKKTASSND